MNPLRLKIFLVTMIAVMGGGILAIHSFRGKPNDNANTVNLPTTATLAAIGDGQLVGHVQEDFVTIDTRTGRQTPLVPATAIVRAGELQTHEFRAPSQTKEIIVSGNLKTLSVAVFPNRTPALLYTAPAGMVIVWPVWSADERKILFGLASAVTTDMTELTAGSFVLLDRFTTKASTVLSLTDLRASDMDWMFPLGVSANGDRVVLAGGNRDQDEHGTYVWDVAEKKLSILPVDDAQSPQFVSFGDPDSEGDGASYGQLFWVEDGTARFIRLDTLQPRSVDLRTTASTPLLVVSPSGHWILVEQSRPNTDIGTQLALIDAVNGQTTVLKQMMPGDVTNAWWTPDETKLVFATSTDIPTRYALMRLDDLTPTLTPVADANLPSDFSLEGIMYPEDEVGQ